MPRPTRGGIGAGVSREFLSKRTIETMRIEIFYACRFEMSLNTLILPLNWSFLCRSQGMEIWPMSSRLFILQKRAFHEGDVLVVFWRSVQPAVYVNGLIEEAKHRGMKIRVFDRPDAGTNKKI